MYAKQLNVQIIFYDFSYEKYTFEIFLNNYCIVPLKICIQRISQK